LSAAKTPRRQEKQQKIMNSEPDHVLDELARRVIGAAIEVHRELGPGYQEAFCEEALAFEFQSGGIGFERQKAFSVNYKGRAVGEGRVDFLVESKLVVELKAVERLIPVHKAQLISYLKATRCRLGLLINFNENLLRDGVQRVVLTKGEPG
jgi:GxxExxY protein